MLKYIIMEITIEQIISVFKNAKDTKKMAEIKKAVCAEFGEEMSLFDNIDKEIEKAVRQELKRGNESLIVRTKDGKLCAHFEHTIAITDNGPIILTDPD